MNRKSIAVILLLTSVILAGAPGSFARPQYLANLTAVYGDGSCRTCHVIASGSGQRDFNGTFGQHNFSNGTFERRDPNRTFASRGSNGTFRQRNSSRTLPLNSYGTLFENQPDHAADPSAALMAIGQPPAAPADTAVPATGAQSAPGFGSVAALVGLFACALLARRHNK